MNVKGGHRVPRRVGRARLKAAVRGAEVGRAQMDALGPWLLKVGAIVLGSGRLARIPLSATVPPWLVL